MYRGCMDLLVVTRDRHGLGPSICWVGSNFLVTVVGWVGFYKHYGGLGPATAYLYL